MESCGQYCLGCAVVATHHSSFCNPQQVQPSPPHPDDIRSVTTLVRRFDALSEVVRCLLLTAFLHAECLSHLTSASAIFSLILLCGVILMVGFLNLEYYTGEWQDAGWSSMYWFSGISV